MDIKAMQATVRYLNLEDGRAEGPLVVTLDDGKEVTTGWVAIRSERRDVLPTPWSINFSSGYIAAEKDRDRAKDVIWDAIQKAWGEQAPQERKAEVGE